MTTYKERLATIKSELLADVASLRAATHKDISWDACTWSYTNWRAKHIAYCLFRGRTMEQIENKRRDPNAPIHKHVDFLAQKYLAAWTEECAEDISAWAARRAERAAVAHE